MIQFERVSKRYPNGREALTNVDFFVGRGELVFITGRSGAGKSTLLKLIALLERPSRGTVSVNGHSIGGLHARHIPAFRRQIGMVFQDHKLLADRPVFDNVALPLVVAGAPLKEIDKRVLRRSTRWGCSARSACSRWSCPSGSSSASASPARSSASRRSSWPMSQPATSTRIWPSK